MAEPLTLGVEEEFLLASIDTGALMPRAREAVAAAATTLGAAVTPELNLCQIEIGTAVHERLDELEGDLWEIRRKLAAACRPLGLVPLATGTHPFSRWQDQEVDRSNARYRSMEDRYQIVARQQVICGYHVHVTVPDPAVRIEVMNRARLWLAVLLALSANSPFWQGTDSGYASYRTQVWQRWPMAGMPPALDGPDAFDELVCGLTRTHAIEDSTHLYWYVRPSSHYPTVEFRICDVCLDPADAATLAGLIRAVVWTCADAATSEGAGSETFASVAAASESAASESAASASRGSPPAVTTSDDYHLRAGVWRAARYGLDDLLAHPHTGLSGAAPDVVRSAVALLGPGLEVHGDRVEVEAGVERILARGNGASWQRRVADSHGPLGLVERVARRTIEP